MDIEIVSGFLGAGKTTFLKQYLPLLTGKTVVIENEYGEIGLDGDLIQSDIPVKELYAGCICCSLAVDFRNGIREIVRQYQPDRIVIEPSGVGKLSDIVKVCEKVRDRDGVELLSLIHISASGSCPLEPQPGAQEPPAELSWTGKRP